MAGIFLDSSVLVQEESIELERLVVQTDRIGFEFPQGLTQLPLIEECRALNALDLGNPDNFDLMYDITMQSLVGKVVSITYDENGKRKEIARFVVTDRYMNMRSIDIFDLYPVIMNWLVMFMAGYLGKKYPRSLQSFQEEMGAREGHTSLK